MPRHRWRTKMRPSENQEQRLSSLIKLNGRYKFNSNFERAQLKLAATNSKAESTANSRRDAGITKITGGLPRQTTSKLLFLKRKLGRELELARVEHGSRSAEDRARDGRSRDRAQIERAGWRPGAGVKGNRLSLRGERAGIVVALGNCAGSAEYGGAVHGGHFVNVRPIEKVEGIHDQIERVALLNLEIAGDTQIPGIQMVAVVGVARRSRRRGRSPDWCHHWRRSRRTG